MSDRIGEQIDRYVIERYISDGGMASVYQAKHAELGTLHAVKILKHRSGTIADRMLQEGRIQARLRHPNIVSVTDVARTRQEIALVMDFVDGPPLGVITDRLRLDHDQIEACAQGIFDGIEVAHALGLVHRDLKPDNILLDLSNGRVSARIMDFGLAKALRDELRVGRSTRSGSMMGTPQYMAPEQYRDSSTVDARADLYSIGAILYELIAGQPLFADADLPVLLAKSQLGEWTPLDQIAPETPASWVAAVHACLAQRPQDRPNDIGEVRELWQPRVLQRNPWTCEFIEQLRELGRSLPNYASDEYGSDQGFGSHAATLPVGVPSLEPETADDWAPAPRPTRRPALGWMVGSMAGGLFFGASAAVLLTGILAAVLWGSSWLASSPEVAQVGEAVEVAEVDADRGEPVDPGDLTPTRTTTTPGSKLEVLASPLPAAPVAVPAPVAAASPAPAPPTAIPVSTAPQPVIVPVTAVPPEPVRAVDPNLARVRLPDLDGYLIGADQVRYPLNAAPPGTYQLFVFFDLQRATLASAVTLVAGEEKRLRCDDRSRMCR